MNKIKKIEFQNTDVIGPQNQTFELQVRHSACYTDASCTFLCFCIHILLDFALLIKLLYLDSGNSLWYLKNYKKNFKDDLQSKQNMDILWFISYTPKYTNIMKDGSRFTIIHGLSFLTWSLLDLLYNWTFHGGLLFTIYEILEKWLGNQNIPLCWQMFPRSLEVPWSSKSFL